MKDFLISNIAALLVRLPSPQTCSISITFRPTPILSYQSLTVTRQLRKDTSSVGNSYLKAPLVLPPSAPWISFAVNITEVEDDVSMADAERWQRLFGHTRSEAIRRIKDYRHDLSRYVYGHNTWHNIPRTQNLAYYVMVPRFVRLPHTKSCTFASFVTLCYLDLAVATLYRNPWC